ncbi:NAD(P)-binding protein [Candidatus Manganitrophus noduliformans]|uniref:NAD(P)-binding protein n=1 Tax=Candidatus Manganitrophus noduliformans TaxID=2606439 RepID=UPI001438D24E|nr:NAD(P)/FAD-dependent oxidoreductase [Candidatus Manganitrophus noduliformans]
MIVGQTGPKIKIAGAGPSGLTAAIVLAKAGYEVDLFEGRKAVGARFIGDFQVIENMSREEDALEMLKRFGLDTNFFIRPVRQALFFDHRLRSQEVGSRRPFGYFIRRGSERETLDRGLLTQALAAGAKIHYQTRIKPEEADIIATGPATPDGLAKEMTFTTSLPDTVWVLFDMNFSPGGYAYLFVLDGIATFGCAITRDLSRINYYFDRSLQRFQELTFFPIENDRTAYSFMNFSLKASAEASGRYFVGEAGGFQDYLFGLGIRYALTTGYAAAESLLKKTSYDRLWKEALGPAQEISVVNRFLYEWGGNRGLSLFIRQAGRGDLQDYLGGWHRPSWWKRLALPILKWGWQRAGRCAHRLSPHWCRHKPVSSHPELGPIKP